jgi:hypothetical protein
LLLSAKHLFFGAKLWGMGCTHHAARRFEQHRPGYLVALERNRGSRISPLLGRFAPHAGLVTLRQTFVLRSHGGNWRCRAVKDEQWDLLSPEF